jgi:hypothetical protein
MPLSSNEETIKTLTVCHNFTIGGSHVTFWRALCIRLARFWRAKKLKFKDG